MKKIMIAAVAATMASVSMADISIKGDAHVRYANIDQDLNALGGRIPASNSTNSAGQRVRLHVTGTAGDTTVKVGLRNDGGTRVSGGARQTEGANTGSGGGQIGNTAVLTTDYLYLTTKIGALSIKAGDWWDTTGLGVARKGKSDADRVELSTKVAGWKVGVETGAGSSSTVFSASGKVGGFDTKIEHDTNANPNAGIGAPRVGSYTDVSIKGKSGAVGIAAEYFKGNLDDNMKADAKVVHVWTKAGNITWHAAWAGTDADKNQLTGGNSKFSPLGVSILGSAAGINGNLAIGDFGNAKDTVFGVRADTKVAGMGVQVTTGKLKLNQSNAAYLGDTTAIDSNFVDLIVTRKLGAGSDIKFSAGTYADVSSVGTKISVKF